MSWITDLFTDVAGTAVEYGGEFLNPTNLAKSLGTAGVMSLFGGNSDDFAKNFLMSNLGRTAGNIKKNKQSQPQSVPLNLAQQYGQLNPADKLKIQQNFDSGKLSEKQFNDYAEVLNEKGTYQDYVKIAGQNPALNANVTPTTRPRYGYNPNTAIPNPVPVNPANQAAAVVNYDISNFLNTPNPAATGIATMQNLNSKLGFQSKDLGGNSTLFFNPETGAQFISDGVGGFKQVAEAGKKAPGFGDGADYFTDRLENFDEIMFNKLALEAINPDYYKRRNFEQEAEDRDKRLRNQFREETLNPSRSGFARTMRPRSYAHGGIADLQLGGAANGPGTGTSDSIPARLSDGEFVMTAEAVRNMGNGSRQKGTRKMYNLMNNLEGKR